VADLAGEPTHLESGLQSFGSGDVPVPDGRGQDEDSVEHRKQGNLKASGFKFE